MFDNYFIFGAIPANAEQGTYDVPLVLVSYIIASFGAYAGLTLAAQLFQAKAIKQKRILHWSGACALGCGIWSMHFTGMLAYKMRMATDYNPWLTTLSLAIAIIVAYGALRVIQTSRLSFGRIAVSAVLLGLGVCGMHYTGMAAMNMQAAVKYIPSLFMLSVAIAITACGAALWIIFTVGQRSGRWQIMWRIIAALVMGLAVSGMHYTGMAAARFFPYADCRFDVVQNFNLLAFAIAGCTSVLLVIFTFAVTRRLVLIVGCAVLFASPIIVIVYQGITSLDTNIEIVEKEQNGIFYHSQLLNLVERMQETRGLTYAVRVGGRDFSEALTAKREELSQAINEVDDVDKSYGASLDVSRGWQTIRKEILSLMQTNATPAADVEFRRFTETIHELIEFMNDVEDHSLVSVDTQLDSNYLASAAVHIVPKIIKAIGEIRGLTVNHLVSGRSPQQWADGEIQELQTLYNGYAQGNDSLEEALNRARIAKASSGQFVELLNNEIKPKENEFRAHFERLVLARQNDLSASEFFKLATETIGHYDALYDRTTESFLELLKQRHAEYRLKRNMVLYSSIIAFFGFVALIIFLYRNLVRTETSNRKAIEAQGALAERLQEKERMQHQMQEYTDKLEESRLDIISANKKLSDESAKIQAIMDSALEGIITINGQGVIQTCNKAAEHVFGYRADEIVGQNVSILMPAPHKHNHDSYIKRYLDTRERRIIGVGRELIGLRKDGTQFPMELSVSEISAKGVPLFIGLARDITQQKQKEEELNLARKRAEESNLAKSEFLANMSHELRTPLNSILGMLRLLKESKLADKNYDLTEEYSMADTALRSSTNLLEIVNDILDFSKIEAGGMTLERVGMDLVYILGSVVLTLEPIAKEKHVTLAQHRGNEKYPYVLGDPTRLTRILINLVGNAIKYTEEGRVDIRSFCKPVDDRHIEFRCEIMDTGIGIPKEKLQTVFEKFMQADTSTTRKYGGTGLGLAITKQLVQMMGGSIGIESEVDVGSTFWFTVPFEITDQITKEKQVRKKKMLSGSVLPGSARVLIAEDHTMNQILVAKLMKKFGIDNYEIVGNGAKALKRYQEDSWDVILMDCFMPEKNGYDTTMEIRNLEKETGKHVPIVAMTANAMIGEKEKCLRCGMDEYISKPIGIEELKEVLGQWIRFEDLVESAKADFVEFVADAPVDIVTLRMFSEGDTDLEKELIHAYVHQSDKNIITLTAALADEDDKAWQDAAHMFKGGSLGAGAKKLGALCAEAQHFNGTTQQRKELFEKISSEYEQVKDHLKRIGLL